jgi:hypothetical protein
MSPLWLTNHTSQVFSVQALPGLLVTGSQYVDDPSVSVLHPTTGKLFWSQDPSAEWTWGVALQHAHSGGAQGLAAFGCPFDPMQAPIAPCELSFWSNATGGTLAWKVPLAGAEVSAGIGPPSVAFSADGKSIIATFVDRNATSSPGGDFMAVVDVADPSATPRRALIAPAGGGAGLHVQKITSTSATRALLSRASAADPQSQVHVGVELTAEGKIAVGCAPAIDCKATARCGWLGANDDLSTVLIDATGLGPPHATCEFHAEDAQRWGFALLHGGGRGWPLTYTQQWAQCSPANNSKHLSSLQLAANGSRVLATFAHLSGVAGVGFEACAYDASSGEQIWCTTHAISPPAPNGLQPVLAAQAGDGRAVFAVASEGLLVLDASSKAVPTVTLLYGQGEADDCCAATALVVVDDVAVASIPYGTWAAPWCSCTHSKLVGVAL